jgi:hypothetical protein
MDSVETANDADLTSNYVDGSTRNTSESSLRSKQPLLRDPSISELEKDKEQTVVLYP